ncbi:ComF family protein [Gryllotalpicola reticulitermitis]|uniref:ComF family protein n=1 Tax=Gryllotalpicola reticulitermitis TaxID=1184153 RepID=A0ABV8QA58_9MICO
MWSRLHGAVLDAWAALAPVDCAGCETPDRALCETCRAELAAAVPARHALTRADGTELPVWHALEYGGTARSILLAFKDGGRTDVAPALAAVLRRVVRAALAASPPEARGRVVLAGIPSTRAAFRRRGYVPLRHLVTRAGYRDERMLVATRQTQDQSDLDTTARFANRKESLAVRGGPVGAFVVLLDDIITTGATILEADRAFHAAGHRVLCAVAVARTPRRIPALRADVQIGRKCS